MRKVAILQPFIPHYRSEFFNGLRERLECLDVYVYASSGRSKNTGFCMSDMDAYYIRNWQILGFLFYSPWPLLSKKYETLVLMLHFAHVTTWLLLLTKFIHHKKIVLWGHGISVKRYLKEEKKPDWKLRLLIYLADGVWFYTKKELNIWRNLFVQKKMVSLNNTLSGVEDMLSYMPRLAKKVLKEKYDITESIVLIYCARFDSNYRRVDLLLDVIRKLDNQKFGFIIIGAGHNKPDFSKFENVYDFGTLYETSIKQELFSMADIYFQPGWVGLSIVEAMAYGKPIFTFKRSEGVKQCVEYAYIQPGINGLIFSDVDDCIWKLEKIKKTDIICMGRKAQDFVRANLLMSHMVESALFDI